MRKYKTSPFEMFKNIWFQRGLIRECLIRDIHVRYRGSYLGILWSFFSPLLMLGIFTFVFSVIFQARWGESNGSRIEFALLLFAGLIFFNLFAECISRAPNLILSNTNFVKKVVFPLEILPIVSLLAGLFHSIVSFGIWLFVYSVFIGFPKYTVFLLPFLLIPFSLFLMGLSWFLASLGVFLRDISQFMGLIITAMLFLSPIFYPVSVFPQKFLFILYLNPLTTVIEQSRDILYWGKIPDLFMLGVYSVITLFISWLGFIWFQKTRKGFADVL